MTTAPYIELGFHPTDLRPRDLPHAGAYLGSPAEALEAAFSVVRAQMVAQMRDETRGLSDPTHSQLLRIADLAWQGAFYRFRKVSAPIIADAYMHAYQSANAGDVPMSLIYDLAEKHAEKVGDYFHITSREGLADGFNTLVNRRIPAKAAVDRVLDAYGLTPRQMRAYTSAKQFETPVSDRLPRSLKAKAREYVDRAFTSRIKKMSAQEEHNIDEQAKQFAWMWLQEKGRLNEKAQKLWVTAKDERVCKVCGPLHGKKVGVNQRFRTSQGEFWTPGLHPNCRCVVRLLEHRFSKNAFGVVAKAEWDPKEHPRGGDRENRGRFSRLADQDRPVISTPVIEPAEEKAPVEMTGAGVEMTGRIEMGRQVEMTPVEMVQTEMTQAGTEMTQRVELTEERKRELLEMTITPRMRAEMERSFADIIAEGERQRPVKRPRAVFDRPTLAIQDENGHEYPVYAVVDKSDELNWVGDRVQITREQRFYSSDSEAARIATAKWEQAIADEVEAVMGSGRFHQSLPIGSSTYELDLEDEDVAQVVTWVARQGRTPEGYEPDDDPYMDVELRARGATSAYIERSMSMNELARHLGVSQRDFDVAVLRMDEGHASYEGQTTQLEAGTRHGIQTWITEGLYKVSQVRPSHRVDEMLAVPMHYIEPEVEETERPFPRGILD